MCQPSLRAAHTGAPPSKVRSGEVAVERSAAAPASSGAVELVLAGACAVGYTLLQLRAATPAGSTAATPEFYSQVSLALPAAVTAAYLAFCSLGPRLMAGRPALSCKSAMLVYNGYQALFNACCVCVLLAEVRGNGLRVWANVLPHSWRDRPQYGRIAAVIWLHYNNKYVELLDSVFMVLRKKHDQLSFLHCYHHCLLIWAWLLVLRTSGCVDAYFGCGCNAAIHVLMYSYYLLAALGVRCAWKRYLTVAQMAQFVACAAHSLVVLATPGACPASLPLTQLWVMLNMLFLFGRFYQKQYAISGASARQKAA